jgi:hypothetical protein
MSRVVTHLDGAGFFAAGLQPGRDCAGVVATSTTGSTTVLALGTLMMVLPPVILGQVAGTLVDRVGYGFG